MSSRAHNTLHWYLRDLRHRHPSCYTSETTISDIIKVFKDEDFLKTRGAGVKTLAEIKEIFSKVGRKKRSNKGGSRPGAGPKPKGVIPGEKKAFCTVRLYPTQRQEIIARYGSVQRAVDSLMAEEDSKPEVMFITQSNGKRSVTVKL